MSHFSSDNWLPLDSIQLEPTALDVVKSDWNCHVIAGPGAGKTELLAQRASYLLQTGKCISPRRILALSYKKDAEQNIKERVAKRVGANLASRFVSLTYDAFSKGILDRFLSALPEPYRPNIDYQISNIYQAYESVFNAKLSGYQKVILFDEFVRNIAPLPVKNQAKDKSYPIIDTAEIWAELVKPRKNEQQSILTFPMITVLAEYIVRSNPKIRKALSYTYSHIFLDEFQDTTFAHYNLIKTCFQNTYTVVTAVGDDKQRIMTWAGAYENVFIDFSADFRSVEKELLMNFRSAPRLIEIQKAFMNSLFNKKLDIQPNPKWNSQDGECEIWLFQNENQEADEIAKKIKNIIRVEKIPPREICILVRQKPEDYATTLIEHLGKVNINARNENDYQDLLSDTMSMMLLNFLSLAVSSRSPDAYKHCQVITRLIHGGGANAEQDKKDREVEKILAAIRVFIKEKIDHNQVNDPEVLENLLSDVLQQLGTDSFCSLFPQYKRKDYRDELLNKLTDSLWREYQPCLNWGIAINRFLGTNSIPIMTIHKSKGLEYNTVIFLGLEDQAFWNFKKQPQDEIRNFFVALSRAKQRILFTFASERNSQHKTRIEIKRLYDVLRVTEIVTLVDFQL